MSAKQAIKMARKVAEHDYSHIGNIRTIYELLSKEGVHWHPDDAIDDIVWSDCKLDDDDIANLIWIDNALWDFFNRNEDQYDIYEESMQAHVRVHGRKSAFYPESRPYEDRKWMCFWDVGYCGNDTVNWEVNKVGFFHEAAGYSDDEIAEIRDLELGEQWDNWECGHHWVVRIK